MRLDDAGDGTLADRAECLWRIGLHAAIVIWTENALGLVACTLIDSYQRLVSVAILSPDRLNRLRRFSLGISRHSIYRIDGRDRGRNRNSDREHIVPLGLKIVKSRDILFPWLTIRIIVLHELVVVVIFIGQTGETMSEFVNDDGFESLVMRCGESVGVEYASPTVSVCICEIYDMLIRAAGEVVMEILKTQGCEVSLHVESVEMGAQGSILPKSLSRHAHAAILRRQGDCHEIEAVAHACERLMREDCCDRLLRIFIEDFSFFSSISFGKDRYVYALLRSPVPQNIFMRSGISYYLAYQHI